MIAKHHLLTLLLTLILLIGWQFYTATTATGDVLHQTVPERTPTPRSGGGGGDDGGSGGGGGSSNATATPVPPSLTPTLEPLNFNLEPCGSLVFAADLGTVNVRSGPGTEYEEIREIPFAETVAIVGRAASTEWWKVEFEDGEQGWVADSTGTVFGNNHRARLIEAPPLEDGTTPTPGPLWEPTPNPGCPTLTPSPTPPPATDTPTPTMTPTTEPSATAVPSATASLTPLPPTATPTATATPEPATERPTTAATQTTPADSPGSGGMSGLLMIGFGLIIFGFAIAIVRRSTAS